MSEQIPAKLGEKISHPTAESPARQQSIADGSASTCISDADDTSRVQSRELPQSQPPPAPVIRLLLFGVLLPSLTLWYESASRLCATEWFDPIPTWWHTLLVALVPLSNLLVLLLSASTSSTRRRWLAHLNAVALGVTAAYSVAFLNYLPLAVAGLVFLGMGMLPLSPFFALLATTSARKYLLRCRDHLDKVPTPLPKVWPMALAAIGLLAFGSIQGAVTNLGVRLANDPNPTTQNRGLTLLRTIGSERVLLESCYGTSTRSAGFFSFLQGTPINQEQARAIFYRATGTPFNYLPPPANVRALGLGNVRGWTFDDALGGERVANKVAGLSLESSRLDTKIDASALHSYTEWTLTFKNADSMPAEARAQIELPPGAVVSRLTLWINGEPREAAFGGRQQVRTAYQEIAVVQRRDPVLVTTCGPDRILMQCFPVPPRNGEMKVRIGMTAPLQIRDSRSATMHWPRMIETNFEETASMRHLAWVESSVPLANGSATFREEIASEQLSKSLDITLPEINQEIIAKDPTDDAFVIRQRLQSVQVSKPSRLVIVIDGSRKLAPHADSLKQTLSTLPGNVNVYFAGDESKSWNGAGSLSTWLETQDYKGGRDNIPALSKAWDEAASAPGSALLWIHGPQPVLLSPTDGLEQRFERGANKPSLYTLAVAPGPNRLLEKLDGISRWETANDGASFDDRLKNAVERLSHSERWIIIRDRIARAEVGDVVPAANGHVVRLWGREEIERLRSVPSKLNDAMKLAVQLQLVTPVSGAVVLEQKEQYDRHGLKPVDPSTVPTIPEPGTALMLAVASAALAIKRRRPSFRQ